MLYIHGYADDSKYDSVREIVDAYLQRDDYNVLVLDWTELASGNYLIDAVPNAKQVIHNPLFIAFELEIVARKLSLWTLTRMILMNNQIRNLITPGHSD